MSAGERRTYALLLLDDADDVAVAVRDLPPGPQRVSDGRVLTLREPVALGHKAAVRPLPAGAAVTGLPWSSTVPSARREARRPPSPRLFSNTTTS